MNQKKMHVETWGDVMYPFCYIGKRRFEKAILKMKNQYPDMSLK